MILSGLSSRTTRVDSRTASSIPEAVASRFHWRVVTARGRPRARREQRPRSSGESLAIQARLSEMASIKTPWSRNIGGALVCR